MSGFSLWKQRPVWYLGSSKLQWWSDTRIYMIPIFFLFFFFLNLFSKSQFLFFLLLHSFVKKKIFLVIRHLDRCKNECLVTTSKELQAKSDVPCTVSRNTNYRFLLFPCSNTTDVFHIRAPRLCARTSTVFTLGRYRITSTDGTNTQCARSNRVCC